MISIPQISDEDQEFEFLINFPGFFLMNIVHEQYIEIINSISNIKFL